MDAPTGPVDELTVSEAHALFDTRSRALLGLGRAAFLNALARGDFADRTEDPAVRDLLALLPFAQAGQPTPD